MVTIVIPTYNREEQLKGCLESLQSLSPDSPAFEVIVVDDGSTDSTSSFCRSIGSRMDFPMTYFFQSNKGPAAARNLGVKNAKGEIIAFLDDDCRVEKNWLGELIRGYEDHKVGGTGGRILSPLRKTLSDRYCGHVGLLETPKITRKGIAYVITANASFRKSALDQIGGFDEAFLYPGGEDPELCLRLIQAGYALVYNPGAVVYHFHSRSLAALRKTYFRYGLGESIIVLKGEKTLSVLGMHVLYLGLAFLVAFAKIPSYVISTRSWEGLAYGFLDAYIRTFFRFGLFAGFFRFRRKIKGKDQRH